jgi:hypothetical protein
MIIVYMCHSTTLLNFFTVFCHYSHLWTSTSPRTANESSRAELGLTQAWLMKIRVESSRARETVRAKKPSSNSAHYYSS